MPVAGSKLNWARLPSPPLLVTVKALALPVAAEVSTRCAPSVPVTMLALTPGLSWDLLIASRMFSSVFAPDSMSRLIDLLPMAMVRVPVPTAVLESVNAVDVVFWDVASLLTTML